MIRFVLSKSHPFHGEEVRVVGDCEALGWWDSTWCRELFGPKSNITPPVEGNLTASLLIPVGSRKITFKFIAVRKDCLIRGEEKEVKVPDGIWRLTDSGDVGPRSYTLRRDEPWCSPSYWPGSGDWAVFDANKLSCPSLALRGPRSGEAKTLMVYFHPLHGRLDKPSTSIFNDPYAPPAYGFWRCLEHAVLLIPGCPVFMDGDEEGGSGQWIYENWERSEQAGKDLFDLIENVRKHYSIAHDRVVGFGTSNGGYAILEMMGQFPTLFSKAAAVSAHIETPAHEVAAKIPKNVPLYVWHCINDVVCPSSDIINLVSHLRREEKNVDIWMGKDTMSYNGHEAASHYAVNRGLIDWLLSTSTAKNQDDFVLKQGCISTTDLWALRKSLQCVEDGPSWSATQGWVTREDDVYCWKGQDRWWREESSDSQWREQRTFVENDWEWREQKGDDPWEEDGEYGWASGWSSKIRGYGDAGWWGKSESTNSQNSSGDWSWWASASPKTHSPCKFSRRRMDAWEPSSKQVDWPRKDAWSDYSPYTRATKRHPSPNCDRSKSPRRDYKY